MDEKPATIGEYRVISTLGEGSFGSVYKVEDKKGRCYALKLDLENTKSKNISGRKECNNEYKILEELQGLRGIPSLHFCGISAEGKGFIVMELLGKSLADLYEDCCSKFSLKTICWIAIDMIELLQKIHGRSIISRDVKPENILVSVNSSKYAHLPKDNRLYLVDFGISKPYTCDDSKHIPLIKDKNIVGTIRYASINTHKGIEQSRRDDMEALGYVLAFFYLGKLPWMGVSAPTSVEKYNKIFEIKKSPILKQELGRSSMGRSILKYIESVRALDFEGVPDYAVYTELFKSVLRGKKFSTVERSLDWESSGANCEYRGDTQLNNGSLKSQRHSQSAWYRFKHCILSCFGCRD